MTANEVVLQRVAVLLDFTPSPDRSRFLDQIRIVNLDFYNQLADAVETSKEALAMDQAVRATGNFFAVLSRLHSKKVDGQS